MTRRGRWWEIIHHGTTGVRMLTVRKGRVVENIVRKRVGCIGSTTLWSDSFSPP
jgi:hypothetical protein